MALTLTLLGNTLHIGDTIRVHYKIIEKEVVAGKTKKEKHEEQKERTQAFEGVIIKIKGSGSNQTFTVRHLGVGSIGVERIFPVISPWIKKIDIEKLGKVRRAKLYYLRDMTGKEALRMGEGKQRDVIAQSAPKTKAAKTATPPAAQTAPPTSQA